MGLLREICVEFICKLALPVPGGGDDRLSRVASDHGLVRARSDGLELFISPDLRINESGQHIGIVHANGDPGATEALVTFDMQHREIGRSADGQLAVFGTSRDGAIFLASSIAMLLGVDKVAREWHVPYFASALLFCPPQTADTAFKGIRLLMQGRAWGFGTGALSDASAVATRSGEPPDLIRGVESDLGRHTCRSEHVLVEFSGGLESSTLLLALAKLRGHHARRITAIHITNSRSADTDYLHDARQLAARCGADLQIYDQDRGDPLRLVVRRGQPPDVPHRGLLDMGYQEYLGALRADLGNAPVVNGAGGDALFANYPSHGALFDAIAALRIWEALRFWDALAGYWRTSRAAVATSALRQLLAAHSPYHFRYSTRPAYLRQMCEFLGPAWSPKAVAWPGDEAPRLSAGTPAETARVRAVEAVRHEHYTIPRSDRCGTYVFPFLASPVVAAGLQVPITRLLSRTHDRIALRAAAHAAYGNDHVWGRRKGGAMGTIQHALRAHHSELQERLSDGFLARHGLIEPGGAREALRSAGLGVAPCPEPLLNALAIELFIEWWDTHAASRT